MNQWNSLNEFKYADQKQSNKGQFVFNQLNNIQFIWINQVSHINWKIWLNQSNELTHWMMRSDSVNIVKMGLSKNTVEYTQFFKQTNINFNH